MATDPLSPGQRAILERVSAIPPGYVRTYGDICPGAPRAAGSVLARHGQRVPWHRVVRSDGSLAQGERQRRLLEAEGVVFRGARVAMDQARLDDLDVV